MTEHTIFLNKRDICRLLGVSRALIDQIINHPNFPAPVDFGKRAMWKRDAVTAWVACQ